MSNVESMLKKSTDTTVKSGVCHITSCGNTTGITHTLIAGLLRVRSGVMSTSTITLPLASWPLASISGLNGGAQPHSGFEAVALATLGTRQCDGGQFVRLCRFSCQCKATGSGPGGAAATLKTTSSRSSCSGAAPRAAARTSLKPNRLCGRSSTGMRGSGNNRPPYRQSSPPPPAPKEWYTMPLPWRFFEVLSGTTSQVMVGTPMTPSKKVLERAIAPSKPLRASATGSARAAMMKWQRVAKTPMSIHLIRSSGCT
mmetsp:Transcript_101696/g.283127  ORF Transcript_101696/g.283127 Transcript_101696/m.283127 type:complete len:256 (+) Transcript_101696:310-1077(+)